MRKNLAFRLPNKLILDGALGYTARRLAAVLYSRKNALGACCKALSELASLAQCSIAAAHTALKELEKHGYISYRNSYRYSIDKCRMVYAKNVYTCTMNVTSGYTLIPRSVFDHDVKASSFLLLLYLYYKAGNRIPGKEYKAFPSLKMTARELAMAHSTVCRCIRELGNARVVYARACVKVDRSFSNNSYFFLCQTTGAAARRSLPHPVRPRTRTMAMKRLGVLLFTRHRPRWAHQALFPYIRFSPLSQRWRPPFGWG